jgi:hypothetical protein
MVQSNLQLFRPIIYNMRMKTPMLLYLKRLLAPFLFLLQMVSNSFLQHATAWKIQKIRENKSVVHAVLPNPLGLLKGLKYSLVLLQKVICYPLD